MIGVYTIDQPRFPSNIPSNRWYIVRIFQVWSARLVFAPAGISSEGEILRRHPCSLRVHRGKYLQLKKGVNIPEKSLDLLERGPPGIVE